MKQDIVTETVRKWLAEGRYHPGDQLPTDAELSKVFQVNKCTVGAGLRQLANEDILERAPKRGTIVKRLDRTIPTTNAVALVTLSKGDFYSEIVRIISECLHEKGLYPILINADIINDKAAITAFFEQMTRQSRPFGYLILGDCKFPYELLLKKNYLQSRIVFFLRYHWREKYPHCRYMLADYDALGRRVVEYFAQKGMKQIFFAARQEEDYQGEWSSMQVTIMKSIQHYAAERCILFDDGLFWRLHSGAPIADILPIRWQNDLPTGIYSWLENILVDDVMPIVQQLGKKRGKDYELLGTFNTEILKQNAIDFFDFHIEEIVKTAVEQLTGHDERKEIILAPELLHYSNIALNP